MKVALVTGVSSGIGLATAERLAQIGYRTFGTVRGGFAPQSGIELVRIDVRDRDSVDEGVASVFDRAGRIDVLVNSAGAAMISAAEETSPEEARDLFETNFFGLMRMTQAVLPAMRGHAISDYRYDRERVASPGARFLRVLRSIAPASLLDKGIRKEFGLDPSPGLRPPSPRSAGRGTLARGEAAPSADEGPDLGVTS